LSKHYRQSVLALTMVTAKVLDVFEAELNAQCGSCGWLVGKGTGRGHAVTTAYWRCRIMFKWRFRGRQPVSLLGIIQGW